MQNRYSVFDPQPRFPSDILWATLVSVEFKITYYTRLAADLKENNLLPEAVVKKIKDRSNTVNYDVSTS